MWEKMFDFHDGKHKEEAGDDEDDDDSKKVKSVLWLKKF